MRNAQECLAKAAELDLRADNCHSLAASADYRQMANGWRQVALRFRKPDCDAKRGDAL